jgi:hypothetical protein
LILALGLAVRLLAIRDLVLPQWVDSPHHYTIARLLAEHGRVPPTYEPLLPIDRFLYHFGFHALAVTVHWLSGAALPEVFLLLGQVLQALVPLAAYTAVGALTRRPRAGLFAAVFVAFVSLFPAYYLTWGRYTHLAGVLLLYPALALVWRLAVRPPCSGRFVVAVQLGLLAAGLLLTHYVVFLFWLAFAFVALPVGFAQRPLYVSGRQRPIGVVAAALAVVALAALLGLLAGSLQLTYYVILIFWLAFSAVTFLASLVRRSGFVPRRQRLVALLATACAASLLAAPWLWRLASRLLLVFAAQPQRLAAPPGYNAFPFDYFSAPLERAWLALAAAALAWGLLRGNTLLAAIAAWLALLGGFVNLGAGTWLVTNNALAITLFVPGSLVLGWGADGLLSFSLALLRPPVASPSPAPLDGPTHPSSIEGVARHLPLNGDSSRLFAPRSRLHASRRSALGTRHLSLASGLALLALLSAALGVAGARGLAAQVAILNPDTTLVRPADRPALEWIELNVPADAVFLINAWEWLNGTWAGSDAGGWIWPLTGRRATLPTADYAYASPAYQAQVNALQARLSQIKDAADPAALALLREAGVTHVFIGARGGPFTPEMFLGRSPYNLLFTNGAAWIFAVAESQ